VANWLPYTVEHLRHDYALKRARELKKSGKYKAVRVGYSLMDYNDNGDLVKYSKIYIQEESKCL